MCRAGNRAEFLTCWELRRGDPTQGVWGYLGEKANRSRGAQSNSSMMEKPDACLGALLYLHSNIPVVSVFIS